MWSEKVSWSTIITPRFLAVFEGVLVDVPNWKVKMWWNDGFDGTTSSSVLARLSWRWWSFIQQEMSVRLRCEQVSSDHQDEMRDRVECHYHSSDMKRHVSEWQNLVMPSELKISSFCDVGCQNRCNTASNLTFDRIAAATARQKKPKTAVVKRDKMSGLKICQKSLRLQCTLLIRKGSIKCGLLLLWVRLKISCISQMLCMK